MRRPTLDDLQAITDLYNACDIADGDQAEFTSDDMLLEFQRSGFDPNSDAWLVIRSEDGLILGYAEVWNRKNHASLSGDSYVHPHFREIGIGTPILRVMESRAREHIPLAPPELSVLMRNGVSGLDKVARQQHENEGYTPVRYFWRMEILMHETPPQPNWPSGFTIRNVLPGQDERSLFEALEEAFIDHWGDSPWDFETWRMRRFESESFDPSLWFLAMDGEMIAGAVISRYRQDNGWVSQLAVRRPWRRLGLGLALLQLSLEEFYHRGTIRVGSTVDSQNPTGATRLYERAGMHVANEYIVYEKVLRPGVEI